MRRERMSTGGTARNEICSTRRLFLSMDLALIAKPLDAYERLVRLDKPMRALMLLRPTLWAVWLAAGGAPSLKIVVIFVLGTFLMRSAGCAVNDYADRDFDPHVNARASGRSRRGRSRRRRRWSS